MWTKFVITILVRIKITEKKNCDILKALQKTRGL